IVDPRQVPNPLSGTNDISVIPGDYATYRKGANCSAVLVGGPNQAIGYNSTNFNTGTFESTQINRKGKVFTFGWYGAYDPKEPLSSSVAFNRVGQGAGLSFNPVVVPLQTYNPNSAELGLSPVYLNGISVKIVGKRPD